MTQNLLKHTEEDTQNGQGCCGRRDLILSKLLAIDAHITGIQ